MVQNAVTAPALKTSPGNRWVKGMTSPNPKGRPPSGLALAERMREMLDGGNGHAGALWRRMMLDVACGRGVCIDTEWQQKCREAFARNEPAPEPPANGQWLQPAMQHILAAWHLIASIAYQKPVQQLEIATTDAEADFSRFTDQELADMNRMHAKALGLVEAHAIERPLKDPDPKP